VRAMFHVEHRILSSSITGIVPRGTDANPNRNFERQSLSADLVFQDKYRRFSTKGPFRNAFGPRLTPRPQTLRHQGLPPNWHTDP
jgi:hypothetical protein